MRSDAMRTESNVYYLRDRRARTIAIAQVQRQAGPEFLRAGFFVAAGTLLGLALSNLPSLSGAILTALNVLPTHPI